MKSFKGYLLHEADYRRFLKKNKNLDQDEIDSINKYFSKTNAQAGSSIDWQSKDVMNMTYDQFEEIMKNWSSGRKKTFKPIKIRGTKGKDYWEIKAKTKGFQCIIPLTQKMSQWLNSSVFGCEGADYCIGWTSTDEHWEDIVIGNGQVPIYITNGAEKWVVMIYPDNKEYDVWDRMNSMAKRKNTKIPGFDVKKNLLTSSLKKLYDDIREEYYQGEHFIYKAEISDSRFVLDDKNNLTWYGGVWKNGEWKDGIWEYGVWENGTWRDGEWEDGVWEDGAWLSGEWKDGEWKGGVWGWGIWKDGLWQDGRWKDGAWHDGYWHNGIWENGKWYNGEWENGVWTDGRWYNGRWLGGRWYYGGWDSGTWEGGVWYDGTWNSGTWRGGTWEDGKWYRGNWEDGIWHNGRWLGGRWEGGTWKNGTWIGGTWENGTWENGTWENGNWISGIWRNGTWESGIWRGGYDKNGDYHEAGDSPDKWNL